jgi:hypothetical protein
MTGRLRRVAWSLALARLFRSPTPKQREAYARYLHTLSAAALIGAVTISFSDLAATASTALRVTAISVH